MPVPLILGVIAGGTALYGVVKGVKGAMDQSEAKDLNGDAQSTVHAANRLVDEQRKVTNSVLHDYGERKLRAFNGIIPEFIDAFSVLKNIDLIHTPELDKLNLGEFSSEVLNGLKNDYELLKSSGLGLGAGLGSGAALAFGAYNGTMLLASASTGTAISTLSGAAATNATLAWLGGGTLAAGGGGVALGTMILGGIVTGPALAIFGHIMGNKAEEALNNARINLEQARTIRDQAKLTATQLGAIETVTKLANEVFSTVSTHLRHAVHDLKRIIQTEGVSYRDYSAEQKQSVMQAVKFAQLLKAMIDTPILDQNGALVQDTESRVKDIAAAIN